MRREQRLEQLGRQKRRVAGEDEHLVGAGRCLLGAPHRIPGPERLLLHRGRQPVELVGGIGRDDDDERVRLERPGSLDDPVDHAAAQDRMQMLGRGRAHACPPASGHDDGCELGAGFGHGRHVGWGARIRTWDHGTKARCLTTWPRPSESGRRVYPDGAVDPARVSGGRAGARPAQPPREARRRRSRARRRTRCRRERARR